MYQHGRKTRRAKNPKVILHTAMVLGAALIGVAYILHNDLNSGTEEKTTVPIVTEVKGDQTETTVINEPLFTFELPTDWKQTNRVQTRAANYYEWRSTKTGAADRMLRLHIDTMPVSYKIVRLQPLTPQGNRFILGNISDNCMNFAKEAGTEQRAQGNAPVEAKWENVIFMCDPINNNQTIGTGTVGGGIATPLSGTAGRHKFFFFYEDHNIRPDDKILQHALKSFQAR